MIKKLDHTVFSKHYIYIYILYITYNIYNIYIIYIIYYIYTYNEDSGNVTISSDEMGI